MIFLYVMLIAAFGCSSSTATNGDSNVNKLRNELLIQVEDSDTSATTAFPAIFQKAYSRGATYKGEAFTCSFYTYEVGELNVESGKLIACDPIIMQGAEAFTTRFPVGEFPVQLAMAKVDAHEAVAYSRVLFSDSPVVKWEFALKPGQKPVGLKDSTFYCYTVDAGTGTFIDSVAMEVAKDFNQSTWEHVFMDMMDESKYKGHIYEFGEHNLATFSTGMGDGCYASYVGYDAAGNVCQLLTDFGLIPWWEEE